MSQIQKLIAKFNRVPAPNDITYEEMEAVVRHYGCQIEKSAGRHSYHVIFPTLRLSVPIPVHGKCVKRAYIYQLKELIARAEEERK